MTMNQQITHTFVIRNEKLSSITVGPVTFTGPNAGQCSLVTAPTSPIPASSTTTFQVKCMLERVLRRVRLFCPAAGTATTLGAPVTATVSIPNSDGPSPYTFAVQ